MLLVIFDTMRADFLGCYGNLQTRTPHLDALATRGTLFTQAQATATFTPPSVWAILHSEQVHNHAYELRIQDHYGKRGSLAQRFKDAGYRTAGVVGSSILHRTNGYGGGFDDYLDTYSENSLNNETTLARVLELSDRVLNGDGHRRPYFLFVHLFDPHHPWGDAPPAFRKYPPEEANFARVARQVGLFRRANDFEIDRVENAVRLYSGGRDVEQLRRSGEFEAFVIPTYRSEITWSDDILSRLLDGLRSRGLLEQTIVAVASDHGIGFAEHYQKWGYVFPLFSEALRVPLILSGPGITVRRIDTPVSLLDLGPTLLDLAGIAPRLAEGQSFRSLLEGVPYERPAYAEATALTPELGNMIFRDDRGRFAPGVANRHAALVEGRYKIIHMPAREGAKFELFDLVADPQEANDIYAPSDPGHQEFGDRLLRRRAAGRTAPTGELAPDALERLRALGYLK